MHALYDLKELLCKQLEEYGKKGEMSAAILERVDMLAHAAKNLDKIIESYEESDYSGNDGHSYENRYSMEDRRSMARGRRRDSMGRYSSNGGNRYDGESSRYGGSSYNGSYDDGMENMVESIRGMMGELPKEVQRDAQRFIQKLEEQM